MNFASAPAIFFSSFVIGLSGALMPGPLLALTVRDTARRGIVAAPLLVLGHGLLEAALVGLVLLGLADWLKGDLAAGVIATAGGAVLLWMAVGMLREVRTLRLETEGTAAAAPGRAAGACGKDGRARPVLDGVVASVTNPYWVVWWATIGLGYLVVSRNLGRIGVVSFFAGHVLSDFAWFVFVGAAVAFGRRRFSDRAYRAVVGACAVFLVFFALSFGYMGMAKLAAML